MRNIANVALVLVLLAVIFSQLTGWGIDNYGIKKILPRLVVMAILVNLSFIACQLVVDVSNILGESLKNLFGSIGVGLASGNEEMMSEFVPTMITAILAGVTAAGVGAPIAITIGTAALSGLGPMAVILIVMALLSIVIAVLMFFLMLGARMALVVLCTAVAPVVAVLYILPNTQNWAKKWWKVFWTMLVMYPLCGAILGISELIKGMVISSGTNGTIEIWMAVVGMVGPFLPFFMLPSMLRSAVSMLGSAGAALVNASQSVRKGAGDLANTIQNTDAAKNQMALGRERANARLAGYRFDKKNNEYTQTARGERLERRASKSPGGARARLLATRLGGVAQSEKIARENENLLGGGMRSRMASIESQALSDAVDQRLSLMSSNAEDGGIWMDVTDDNGEVVNRERAAYTLENMHRRMRQLKDAARGRQLNDTEIMEMRALARGMASEAGGAGMLGKMVRNIDGKGEDGKDDAFSEGFVRQLADIYQRDSGVRGKVKEKDSGSGVYLEDFMEGGRYTGANAQAAVDFNTYRDSEDTGGRYKEQIKQRLKTTSAGLGQGGTGIKEYLEHVESGTFVEGFDGMSEDDKKKAVEEQYYKILEDTDLMNSLAADDRAVVEARAADKGVTGRRPTNVKVVGGEQSQPQTQQTGGGILSADGSSLKIDHKGTPSQQQMQEAWERTQYGGRTRNEAEELKQLQEQWKNQQNN